MSGSADYDSGKYEPLTFSFTLVRALDVATLMRMVDNPFNLIPFLPVTGQLETDATTVKMAAVRAQGSLFWSGDDPRPQVRM